MNSIVIEDKPAYLFITDNSAAERALAEIMSEEIIGLDTETYWDAGLNRSHVSLVQIAAPDGEVLVIDLLSVETEVLRPLIESPQVLMAAHNARFDEGMLIGAGLRPASFVDTLRLARSALRLPSYSLAGVSSHLFGIELDKSFQKSNWRRRPLTRAQLQYAATDAHIALAVYQELRRILAEQGRLEDAMRMATLSAPVSTTESRQPRKRRAPLPPLRPLTGEEKKILLQLKKWRLERSFADHKPAYMICQDRTLEHVVIESPETLEALAPIYGLGESRIARFGEELLEALRQAKLKENQAER